MRKGFLLIILLTMMFLLVACAPAAGRPGESESIPAPASSPDPTAQDSQNDAPMPVVTPTSTPESNPEGSPGVADFTSLVENLWGLHINRLNSAQEISLGKSAGVYWTRFDQLNWDLIEPENSEPKNYHWEAVDESALQNAASNGFEPIAIVLFTPAWAQKYPETACGPIAEDRLADFARFMQALVSRYSQPPFNVHYWEIGNEPDIDRNLVGGRSGFGCWGEVDEPYYGGEYYAEMLKTVYPAVKEIDPQAKILIGGLVLDCDPLDPPEIPAGSGTIRDCTSAKFIEGVLQAGGGDYFDGVSFHAYDYYYGELGAYGNDLWHSNWASTGPVLNQKTRYLRSMLEAYGHGDKELLNTELALLCGRDGKEEICTTQEFQSTKAIYLVQAYADAIANGLRANIWYSLTGWRASELVDKQLNPLPVYNALVFNQKMLQGATYQQMVSGLAGVKAYEFENESQRIWLLWSQNGSETQIQLPAPPTTVYDVYGNPVPVEAGLAEVRVTLAPIYVVWDQ